MFCLRALGADPPFGKFGVFANGLDIHQRSSSREPGFDFHTAGVTAGADYRCSRLKLGAALRIDEERVDAGDVSYGFAVGLRRLHLGGFHDGILTYGWPDYDTERTSPRPAGDG
jgi:hypothetical protein